MEYPQKSKIIFYEQRFGINIRSNRILRNDGPETWHTCSEQIKTKISDITKLFHIRNRIRNYRILRKDFISETNSDPI